MMRDSIVLLVRRLYPAVIALVSVCVALQAHHSTVAYSENSIVLKNATIAKVLWVSPHIIVTFDVKEANSQSTHWSMATGSPTSVARVGWNRNSLQFGDKVTLELYPARNG